MDHDNPFVKSLHALFIMRVRSSSKTFLPVVNTSHIIDTGPFLVFIILISKAAAVDP